MAFSNGHEKIQQSIIVTGSEEQWKEIRNWLHAMRMRPKRHSHNSSPDSRRLVFNNKNEAMLFKLIFS